MKETEDKHSEFENILARKLAGTEIAPPEDMWSRIESTRGKNRKLVILRIAAIGLLLLGSGLIIKLMVNESNREIITQSQSQFELRHESTNEQINPETQTSLNEESLTEPTVVLALLEPAYQSTINTNDRVVDYVNQSDEQPISDIVPVEISADDSEMGSLSKEEEPRSKKPLISHELFFEDAPSVKKTDKKIRIGIAYGSNINTRSASEAAPQRLSSSQFGFDEFQGELAYETVFFQQIEHTSFEAPFSVGILLNLPLTKSLRLETGLQYTLLSHESRTKIINNKQSVYNTKLHYLGIPVGLQWIIINGRVLRFYLSQSLIIEKGLSANYSADRFEKDRFLKTEHSQVEIRGIQLSSNNSAGFEVAFQKNLAVFGQAGAQVFLLNKTQPFNLRSEHMIWPSIQTGIRWRILE
jgi:hypothetical protein